MKALMPVLWWVVIVGGASLLAVRRPDVAVRAGTALLTGLVLVWLLLCGIGIAAQVRQGAGLLAVEADTPFHGPHRWLSHVAVILAWMAFWWLVPVAVERVIRAGGFWKFLLHSVVSSVTLGLVLLSAFSGYLATPPVTEGSYLRFRVLHTVLVPFLATVSILGWRVVAGRYRVGTDEKSVHAVVV